MWSTRSDNEYQMAAVGGRFRIYSGPALISISTADPHLCFIVACQTPKNTNPRPPQAITGCSTCLARQRSTPRTSGAGRHCPLHRAGMAGGWNRRWASMSDIT
jgi:hypothetical protein